MIYSKQTFFCNSCGRRIYSTFDSLIGREWKVCSLKCNEQMHINRARSIINVPSNIEEDFNYGSGI